MKRQLVLALCLASMTAAAAPATSVAKSADPSNPYQTYTWDAKVYVPFEAATSVTVECPDPAAAKWVGEHFAAWFGANSPKVKAGATGLKPAAGDEAYAATADETGVKIAANTLAGTRWAAYTLRQLAVADRPHLAFRAVHLCCFPETRIQQIERAIRLAALLKFNYAIIEPWGMYKSEKHPWWCWPDAYLTKSEVKRLVAIGKDLGITLVPQINCYGHASSSRGCTIKHSVLDMHPEYEPLFEPAPLAPASSASYLDGWSWCISNPETQRVLRELIAEIHEDFGNPPYFHIGCDEAFGAQTCPECVKTPHAELAVRHFNGLAEFVKSRGARPMMWHDMLLERGDKRWSGFYANGTPQTAAGFLGFPKDIVICDWFYGGAKDSYPTLDYFRGLGFPTLTCPWMDRKGTVSQGRYAHEKGMDGVLGTLWHHYFGEDLVSIYFTLANAAWKKEPSYSRSSYLVQTHLRQVGWDMKVTDPRRTGVYYDEIPPEPFLDN